MSIAREVAKALLDKAAVGFYKDEFFKWTSGILSPVYCDNRKMNSFVSERRVIVEGFLQKIRELDLQFDVVAGTATAAISWAAFVAWELDKPMIYIRPEPKAHGAKKQIEGFLEVGKKVLIVEDLVSTAGSSVKAAEVVRNEGQCEVADILAIMTWEFAEARELFEVNNLNFHSLTNFSHLVSEAVLMHYLTQEQADKIAEFKSNPREWAQKIRP
jgi:orotate phosphoribosyltransferase